MKTKKIFMILYILIFAFIITSISVTCFAAGAPSTQQAITAMQGMEDGGTPDTTATAKLGPIINSVIAIIQVAGTGISLIMVTILGIRYLLAAPSDKADVKKQIAPMLIGAVILFASVNIVQIIANFTNDTL